MRSALSVSQLFLQKLLRILRFLRDNFLAFFLTDITVNTDISIKSFSSRRIRRKENKKYLIISVRSALSASQLFLRNFCEFPDFCENIFLAISFSQISQIKQIKENSAIFAISARPLFLQKLLREL